MAKYANENIYMFHNKTINATLLIDNDYSAEYVIEWFCKNSKFYEKNNKVYADVTANEQALIYWCLQYGDSIELVSPIDTRNQIKKKLDTICKRYN